MNLKRDHAAADKTIVYLCYGPGLHVEETVFSLLTAFRFLPPDSSTYRYVVYTDNPGRFADLGVVVRELKPAELQDWLGGSDYVHRRKTKTILDALHRYPGDVVFVDCDTYFRRSPANLFDRIGPGRSCLHVLEAHLLESRTKVDQSLSGLIEANEFFDLSGQRLSISPNAPMWNSGVLGMNAADIGLMENVLHVSDQMWAKLKVHHIEQFVTGYFLGKTDLSDSVDTVFHYWPGYIRQPFRKKLAGLLARDAAKPLHIRAERAFKNRPHPPIARAIPVRVRGTLRQMGLNVPGMLMSV